MFLFLNKEVQQDNVLKNEPSDALQNQHTEKTTKKSKLGEKKYHTGPKNESQIFRNFRYNPKVITHL